MNNLYVSVTKASPSIQAKLFKFSFNESKLAKYLAK